MNKMKKYLLMFAALVATTLGFTACSSEDDLSSAEQGQEQARGVVKTQFTISIPQGTSGTTRLASGTVQAGEDLTSFRGIKNIELYPLSSKLANETTSGADNGFPTKATTIPSKILLVGATGNGKYGASGSSDYSIDGASNLYNTSKSHLYQDVDIPIGTKSFMFYGEAAGNEAPEVQGKLNRSTSATTLGDIVFSPAQIHESGEVGTKGTNIATYLTQIANASIGTGENTKKWTATSNVALKSLFEQFTGENESGVLTNYGVRAGSWTDVKAALGELYKNLKAGSADTQETQDMKTAIRAKIVNSDYGVSVNANDPDKLDFAYSENTSYKDANNKVFPYPRNLNLPDGAAFIRWDVTNQKFEALATNTKTGTNFAPLSSYVYPASLYYRVLSDVKTSDTPKGITGTEAYDDNKSWSTILGYYDQDVVTSKTRSIVVKDPIQYAVGRLDATIVANETPLKDNVNTEFAVGSGTAFKVTGILVGGQKPVDYKFEQCTGSTYSTFYTIYDQSIKSGTGTTATDSIYLTTTASAPMYTLALETKSAETASQEDAIVKIAVEFENKSGKTIVGLNNEKIYPGCRFYLIGTLDPYLNTTQTYDGSTADATNHPELIIKKAFVQDYKTMVTLKVANLKKAYNTLPDLTIPQLEMGLSVNLGWKTGISQDINME